MNATAPVLLQVRDLVKRYGAVEALGGVSFDVAVGETVAVIGPNGAGKSTLFNVINGQLRADAGNVMLDRRAIGALPPRHVAALGVARTFQVPAVFASMTVLENVTLAATAAAKTSRHAAMRISEPDRERPSARFTGEDAGRALLARIGIEVLAHRACASLAYGDLKRVELGIALAGGPRLLLMDEPTAGMPPVERRQLMALVDEVTAESRLAVLFTEHDMDIVFAHADRVLVLDQGRLIASGTPAEVRANPKVQAAYLGTASDAAEHA